MKNNGVARLSLAGAVIIFGTIGAVSRNITLPSSFTAMVRGIIAVLFLTAVIFISGKKIDFAAIKKNILPLVISGAGIGINWVLLFEAYKRTSVAVATVCYYTSSVMMIIAAVILFKEKFDLRRAACVAGAVAGTVLVSGVLETGFYGASGAFFALGAAFFYAAAVTCNRYIHGMTAMDKTIVQMGVGSVAVAPYFFLTENISAITFDAKSLVWLLVLGIVHTGTAYALYFYGYERMKSQTAALMSYIDPAVAIIISAVFLKENIGIGAWIGSALIFISAIFS